MDGQNKSHFHQATISVSIGIQVIYLQTAIRQRTFVSIEPRPRKAINSDEEFCCCCYCQSRRAAQQQQQQQQPNADGKSVQ